MSACSDRKEGLKSEVECGDVELSEEISVGSCSPARKFFVWVVAVFLLFIFVFWSFSGVLESRVESSVVRGGVLRFGSERVVFSNGSLERLQGEFIDNQGREIKACAYGRAVGSDYFIERVSFPVIIRANVLHVVSEPCPEGALFDIHSHPVNECIASGQDIRSLKKLRLNNPDIRMLVMCAPDRFSLV